MNTYKQPFDSRHAAFIVRLPIQHSHVNEFKRGLIEVIERMAEEPDFRGTWLHCDAQDPDTFVLFERWACTRDEFLKNHLTKDYRIAYEAQLPEMLKAPRVIEFLDTQGIWVQ